jgi:hypothetical protein
MKRRNEDNDAAADDSTDEETERESEEGSNPDETDADDPKRFERSDNLRRRSEWFQKRTGGR